MFRLRTDVKGWKFQWIGFGGFIVLRIFFSFDLGVSWRTFDTQGNFSIQKKIRRDQASINEEDL